MHEAGRARIFAEAQHFLAGEMQAVLREASLGSQPKKSCKYLPFVITYKPAYPINPFNVKD